jgi:hypothetical protein
MPRPPQTITPEPRRHPPSLQAETQHPPAVRRPALPARPDSAGLGRRPPASPLAVRRTTPPQISLRRSRPGRFWLGVVVIALVLAVVATFTLLLLTGRDDVIAWLVVGCVLVVVFGTPLLCVVGLVVFYVWAVSRIGRARSLPRRPPAQPTPAPQYPVVVGEVLDD